LETEKHPFRDAFRELLLLRLGEVHESQRDCSPRVKAEHMQKCLQEQGLDGKV